MATPRKELLVRCGHPLAEGGGTCRRLVEPGGSGCGFHPATPAPDAGLPVREFCECEHPFAVDESDPDMGLRCLICGKYERPVQKRSPQMPPNATNGPGPSDRSRDPVPGEQLSLLDKPAAMAVTTKEVR